MNTLSYERGTRTTALINQTIGDYFDAIAHRLNEHAAVISRHESIRLTYGELRQKSDDLAAGLLASGLEPGDRIGIWSHTNIAWLLMQLATAKAGLILVNINPAYRSAELEHALNLVGCKAIVTMVQYRSSEYLNMLRELGKSRLPKLETIWWIDESGAPDEAGAQRFSGLFDLAAAGRTLLDEVRPTVRPDDAVNIQFTSGTTGLPKAATLSHRNILNNGYFVGECMKLTQMDRVCVPVPMYHCFGMVMGNLASLTHGSTIVYPAARFDAEAVLEAVQAERCTALLGVPTMFIAALNHPRFAAFDKRTLRTGIMAGSPCPIEIMRRVVDEMNLSEITIAYGMTETSPVSCQSMTDTPLDKRVTTVGQVLPHLEIKIVDQVSGETVDRGQPGELCTRGYSVMLGYWNQEERTKEAIDAKGWMHTGDLATMDAAGYVNIVGRIKDMVIRGGENLYPREIEEFLYTCPGVLDVQVVGVPDKHFGEELCAWIVTAPGAILDEGSVREFCQQRIAHYKVPKYIRFVDSFPTTVTGKIQKYLIRQIMSDELGLQDQQTA
ncbi:AMP-binding protein [Paraburkholderia sp. J11-2]|uniref:AMP-binding protein n=1 Tax=Paraburkholderia sp. J11-2 TaxID=2805431 RepID=UPI002AB7930F|nr:AMP-binding protein [Paraburkholderia sp. J11-2]